MGIDKNYVIRISEDAAIQLILNALEAHSVFHPGKKKAQTCLETYGLLWGHEIRHSMNKIIYSIELISIDTSANRTGNSVDPNDSSLKLKRNLMTAFWPYYEFLGDVHTHPYNKNYSYVVGKKYYNYSPDDFKRLENHSPYWEEHNYRVGLVLTIARMDRAGPKEHYYKQENMIEFTLDKYRLWLKGYVLYEENEDGETKKVLKVTDHNAGNVFLDCPSLVGLKPII
ncbi:MAG: hypothetical protein KKA10_05505 [Euryarchaeota archaeon]|nr:hypothetical protein [Euryarchaeota archaeon]MCG2736750.1 hypothetical protein [Candidatus Methanoperedenaceae archaeon]